MFNFPRHLSASVFDWSTNLVFQKNSYFVDQKNQIIRKFVVYHNHRTTVPSAQISMCQWFLTPIGSIKAFCRPSAAAARASSLFTPTQPDEAMREMERVWQIAFRTIICSDRAHPFFFISDSYTVLADFLMDSIGSKYFCWFRWIITS